MLFTQKENIFVSDSEGKHRCVRFL